MKLGNLHKQLQFNFSHTIVGEISENIWERCGRNLGKRFVFTYEKFRDYLSDGEKQALIDGVQSLFLRGFKETVNIGNGFEVTNFSRSKQRKLFRGWLYNNFPYLNQDLVNENMEAPIIDPTAIKYRDWWSYMNPDKNFDEEAKKDKDLQKFADLNAIEIIKNKVLADTSSKDSARAFASDVLGIPLRLTGCMQDFLQERTEHKNIIRCRRS